KTGTAYGNALSATEIAFYGTLDANRWTLGFNTNALGRSFMVTVAPQWTEGTWSSFSHEFTVTRGTNIYTEAELSMFDNTYLQHPAAASTEDSPWVDYKLANGVPMPETDINGLVLHNNLNLTAQHIPASFIDARDNSLINWAQIYSRYVTPVDTLYGETQPATDPDFAFWGNYFLVNASAIPLITRTEIDDRPISETDKLVISHVNLFYFTQENGGIAWESYTEKDVSGRGELAALQAAGNTSHTEAREKSGGLIFFRSDLADTYANDIVVNAFYSMLQFDRAVYSVENTFRVNRVISKNSFSNMIYLWEGREMFIQNSLFQNSGGPVLIASDPWEEGKEFNDDKPSWWTAYETANNTTVMRHPTITIDDLSKLDSKGLTGEEAWFEMMSAVEQATLVAQLAAAVGPLGHALMTEITVPGTANKVSVFNPRVLFFPDKVTNNFRAVGQLYVGTKENRTLVLDTNMPADPAYSPFTAGIAQFYNQGAPIFGNPGTGGIPGLLALVPEGAAAGFYDLAGAPIAAPPFSAYAAAFINSPVAPYFSTMLYAKVSPEGVANLAMALERYAV
ncbi:MAG: hypothetical protein LBM78_03750, partial [Clostridiales bacterium]|nr:hypothetical protein [Clostridiales bacterium]